MVNKLAMFHYPERVFNKSRVKEVIVIIAYLC